MVEAVIVVDLGFGDSGKGTITEALVHQLGANWVVRHNGGAQAGHNVVLPDGRSHTFSQFSAGTFTSGVNTYLSKYMVLHPGGLLEEARVLRSKGVANPLRRVFIDPDARVITPFHQAANRLREILRGAGRHGSCGLGVGETMNHSLQHPEESLIAADLLDPEVMRAKLVRIQQRYFAEFHSLWNLRKHPQGASEFATLECPRIARDFLAQAREIAPRVGPVRPSGRVVFEGAQGVLLDEWRGFHPYTTWSTCTFDNALTLVREWGGRALRMGVVRSYATRHGAGPFPTEDELLELPEPHNKWGPWQHGFRQGWLDLVLLRYAVKACGGLDGLAVTHLDRVQPEWKISPRYQELDSLKPGPFQDLDYQESLTQRLEDVTPEYDRIRGPIELCQRLEALAPIMVTSWGPTAKDKRFTQRFPLSFSSTLNRAV